MNRPPLTAERLDQMFPTKPRPARKSSLAIESLWGAQAIADFMGVSDDFVRKLAKDGLAPIRLRGGRYFSTKTEITAWLMPGSEEAK